MNKTEMHRTEINSRTKQENRNEHKSRKKESRTNEYVYD